MQPIQTFSALASLALLLGACSQNDSPVAHVVPEPVYTDEAFAVSLSNRTEPMVWMGSYGLDSRDSIIPGTTTREITEGTSPALCAEQSQWWYTVNYRPLYQSKERFLERITTTTDSIELLNPGKLMRVGHFKYVTDVNRGVHIYDDTDPAKPIKVAFLAVPGVLDIALKNNILFANAYSALVAIDISTPAQAHPVEMLPDAFPPIYIGGQPVLDSLGNAAVAWYADTTWYCGYPKYLYDDAISTGAPEAGAAVDTASAVTLGQNASLSRFAISETRLYTVDSYSLRVFDVTNESAPRKGSVIQTNSWDLETIFRKDSVLYLGSMTGMLTYVQTSGAEAPIFASKFSHITSCDPVVVEGNIAYVTLRSGTRCANGKNELQVLDVADPFQTPKSLASLPLSNPAGLALDDTTLFVCEGSYGLTVIDVKNPAKPQVVSQEHNTQPEDVIAADGVLTLIGPSGLWRFDYTDRTHLVLLNYESSVAPVPYEL